MAKSRLTSLVISLAILLTMTVGLAHAQRPLPGVGIRAETLGNTFTYQGYLQQDDRPIDGVVDLRFSLWDEAGSDSPPTGGQQVGYPIERLGVSVSMGLFSVELNLGDVFKGERYWLEVAVRNPAGSGGTYTTLTPRQPLTATPYAIYSRYAPWSGLQGMPDGFADGVDNDTLGSLVAAAGQVPQWNGSAWRPATLALPDYSAGPGLTLTDGQFSLAFSGDGLADTVARSDHNHIGVYAPAGHNHDSAYALSRHGHEDEYALTGHNHAGTYALTSHDHAGVYAASNHQHAGEAITSGTIADARIPATIARDSEIMPNVLASDGAGSGLDADLLDGHHATAFASAAHNHTSDDIAGDLIASYAAEAGSVPWSGVSGVPEDLDDGDDDTLGDLIAEAGQVPQWNGTSWIAATLAGTSLIPGLGLRANGDQFDVDFAGDGKANTVARSDHAHSGVYAPSSHTHSGSEISGAVGEAGSVPWTGVTGVPEDLDDGDDDTLGDLIAEAGQVPQWNGNAWVAATPSGGDGGPHDHFGESWSGTNSSGAGLSVSNSARAGLYAQSSSSGSHAVYALNNGGGPALYMRSTSGRIMEAYGSDPSNIRFRFENDGNAFADKNWNASDADFAEMLPAEAGLEPGDVLAIGADGTLVRSTTAYQPSVAGVYSTAPGFVGGAGPNDDLTGKVPLAVLGVVPVKASAENGAIRPGDLLVTAAIPGHAMRAGANPPLGSVVGKALAELSEGSGVIRMLVTLQ